MWLVTPNGFFSIVQKPDDKSSDTLTIRSRVRADLDQLRERFLPALGPIQEIGGTDYRFRAKAPRGEIATALANITMQLDYANFKDEVTKRQGKGRAATYGKVWDVLYKLQDEQAPKPALNLSSHSATKGSSSVKAHAYGGIVIDDNARVLLRRPQGDYDGYVWTFPKGRPDPGETPEQAALREVKEETGYVAVITRALPGRFHGGTTTNKFFLMSPVGEPGKFDSETAAIKWASYVEAASLISMTTNEKGRKRDLAILDAVMQTTKSEK